MAGQEEWKAVAGYEGFYEVSNLERVRSLPRTVKRPGGGTRTIDGRILATEKNSVGVFVVLYRGRKRTRFAISDLVERAFG